MCYGHLPGTTEYCCTRENLVPAMDDRMSPQFLMILFYHIHLLVFCYQNCSELLWEKNCSNDREKLLKFEIIKTIYSSSALQ